MIFQKTLIPLIVFINIYQTACVTNKQPSQSNSSEALSSSLIIKKIRQILDEGQCQSDFPMLSRTWGDLAQERTVALQCLSSCQTSLEKIRLIME